MLPDTEANFRAKIIVVELHCLQNRLKNLKEWN